MSKKVYLFSLVLLALAFTACSETEETSRYDNWRSRNEAFIDSLQTEYDTKNDHGGLSRFEMEQAPGNYIYYKKKEAIASDLLIKEKEGLRPSAGTTSITVYYKGVNMLGEYFDGNFTGKNPIANESNPSLGGDTGSTTFTDLSNLIVGWQEALIKMTVGERWEVFIPWQYGYGNNDNTNGNITILGYSALIFDIQLLDADPVIKKD